MSDLPGVIDSARSIWTKSLGYSTIDSLTILLLLSILDKVALPCWQPEYLIFDHNISNPFESYVV